MKLVDVFKDDLAAEFAGLTDVEVRGIELNSKQIQPGDIFVALAGKRNDGHAFIAEALENGAVAVVSEKRIESLKVPVVVTSNVRQKLGAIASRIYGEPTKNLTVVGVTGTNGKTTVACLVEHILTVAGFKTGYLGTIGYKWNGTLKEADRTTPEACALQRMFQDMHSSGVTHVVMECSSHGIDQGRLEGIHFDVCAFTNLTQDHLDDHETMENYASIKRRLFDDLLERSSKKNKIAIYNADDPVGFAWYTQSKKKAISFSAKHADAKVSATNVILDERGIQATLHLGDRQRSIRSNLLGAYNLSNILAAVSVGTALAIPDSVMEKAIASFTNVPGRLEKIPSARGFNVLVDYAHTDDAMHNVLSTLRNICKGKLVVVFGCGGNRDRAKRPKMMSAVEKYADEIVVTIDNPRREEPSLIVEDILKGRQRTDITPHVVLDRQAAIQKGIELLSSPSDIMIVTGKGHETYQEVRGEKLPFDDRQVAMQILQKIEGAKA